MRVMDTMTLKTMKGRKNDMRKLLRSMAKAKMKRMGYSKINRHMAYGEWRRVLGKGAYPGFYGNKKQKKGSRQPVLKY